MLLPGERDIDDNFEDEFIAISFSSNDVRVATQT